LSILVGARGVDQQPFHAIKLEPRMDVVARSGAPPPALATLPSARRLAVAPTRMLKHTAAALGQVHPVPVISAGAFTYRDAFEGHCFVQMPLLPGRLPQRRRSPRPDAVDHLRAGRVGDARSRGAAATRRLRARWLLRRVRAHGHPARVGAGARRLGLHCVGGARAACGRSRRKRSLPSLLLLAVPHPGRGR
jgi:hypothetical protein